jgi:hypothetical protein
MSMENPLWGAPRIHGELLKLGLAVAQSSVAKYMVKRRGPPSQGWCTFLHNHAPDIAAMDLFVVPTIGFKLLYAFVIVRLNRRDLVWINVTANPNAEWIARQITEAFPWNEAQRYMIRDRDRDLWCRRHTPTAGHGHPGQAYRTGLTLAEWLCRTADRIDPSRVSRSCHHPGRSAFTSDRTQCTTIELGHIGLWTRCADLAASSAHRSYHFKSDPWRNSSPLIRI